DDARISFIHDCVAELDHALRAHGGGLHVLHGAARDEIPRLARALRVQAVFVARDYEPDAVARDEAVGQELRESGIALRGFKDQVVFEVDEVVTAAGKPYSVFTPYRSAWLARLAPHHVAPRAVEPRPGQLAPGGELQSLESLGFRRAALPVEAGMSGARRAWAAFRDRIAGYAEARDFPAREGTSGLSPHLRFGTLSVRELVRFARGKRSAGAQAWLSELVWREFYFAALGVRPDSVDHAWRGEFDALRWED